MTAELEILSKITETILCLPYEWCRISGGKVTLLDASSYEGTRGGEFEAVDFAIAKYYTYRVFKGGAWNVNNPEHLRANDRYGHPPRGRLNEAGFRITYRD